MRRILCWLGFHRWRCSCQSGAHSCGFVICVICRKPHHLDGPEAA